MHRTLTTAAAAAAVLTLALTGCATTTDPGHNTPPATPQTPATTPPPHAEVPQLASIDDVVDQVAAVYWSADTTTDTTPRDAARRTVEWLTPTHAAQISEDLPGNPGHRWLTLAEHNGKYLTTTLDATTAMPDLPPDTDTTASRGRIITLTPIGADGWTGEPITLVVRFDLTRTTQADPWLVDHLTINEPLAHTDNIQDYG